METSDRTRTSLFIKMSKGLFVGAFLPYGYIRSKENKNKLVVDEIVKDNVVSIFSMYIGGKSIGEIARHLNKMNILSPMAHFEKYKIRKLAKNCNTKTYMFWQTKHVKKILSCEIYTGDMVQGTTTSVSYKVTKRIPLPRENWIIVKNTHEPIVSHDIFSNAHKILSKKQKPVITRNTVPSIFAGYLYCNDCKKPMVRNIKRVGEKQYKKFLCSNFKKNGASVCSSHYIDESIIYDVVLFSIQHQINCVKDINNVLNKISSRAQVNSTVAYLEKQCIDIKKQIKELDRLIKESYLDYKADVLNEKDYITIKNILSSDAEKSKTKQRHIENELENATNMKFKYNEYIKEFIKYKNIMHIPLHLNTVTGNT